MRFSPTIALLSSVLFCSGLRAADAPRFALELKEDQLLLSVSATKKIPLTSKALTKELTTISSVQRVDANTQLVTFVLPGPNHASRTLTVLLTKPAKSDAWSAQQEWTADKLENDAGSKDETQTFAVDATGTLTRKVHRLNVDNISYELPCKCCTGIQTKTMETQEEETLAWNATSNTFERRSFRKWYITQPGEGLVHIARKALGDPSRLSRLYTLNPELRQTATLAEGQKVLVDKL